jgi:hypothetical protein
MLLPIAHLGALPFALVYVDPLYAARLDEGGKLQGGIENLPN